MTDRIELTVNHRLRSVPVDQGERTLLEWLREDLGLKGTKNGCAIGACGICMVLADAMPLRACVTKLKKLQGKSILTIEGLEDPSGRLHPLQQAFIDSGAVQCGFCIPAMILVAWSLLQRNSSPDRAAIRQAIRPVLCRCTGYQQIVEAVENAARIIADGH